MDLDALRAYRAAVRDETRAFLETYDFDRLDDPIDVAGRLAAAPLALGPGSEAIRPNFEQRRDGWYWLPYLALQHSLFHLGDAEHVARTMRPGGDLP